MDLAIILLIAIIACFVVCLVTSWPRGYNAGTIASALGLVFALIILFKPM